jgi:hypothetical protein
MIYGMTDDEIVEAMHIMSKTIDDLEARFELATRFQIAEDIAIEKRGENRWCVSAFGGTVVDRDLQRHYEPMPSSRTEEFIAATRFDLDEAFEIAQRYNKTDQQ